jgi:hypothetical protein
VQRAARFNTWLFFQNRDLPRDFPRLNGENHGKIMGKWMNFVIKYLRATRVDLQTPTCWDLYFCHQKKSLDHPIEVKIPH